MAKVIQDFEKKEFKSGGDLNIGIVNKKRTQGEGIGSIFSSIGNLINANKQTISTIGEIGKATSNIASAAQKINDVRKTNQEIENLKKTQEILSKQKSQPNKIAINDAIEKAFSNKQGDGFYKVE